MSPEELLDKVRPFFPKDFPMARTAVGNEYPDLPMWLRDAITFMLFESLEIERFKRKYPKFLEGLGIELSKPKKEEPPKVNFNTYIYML